MNEARMKERLDPRFRRDVVTTGKVAPPDGSKNHPDPENIGPTGDPTYPIEGTAGGSATGSTSAGGSGDRPPPDIKNTSATTPVSGGNWGTFSWRLPEQMTKDRQVEVSAFVDPVGSADRPGTKKSPKPIRTSVRMKVSIQAEKEAIDFRPIFNTDQDLDDGHAEWKWLATPKLEGGPWRVTLAVERYEKSEFGVGTTATRSETRYVTVQVLPSTQPKANPIKPLVDETSKQLQDKVAGGIVGGLTLVAGGIWAKIRGKKKGSAPTPPES